MPAFTAIAAGVGLAATAATTTGSFIQAKNQRNAMLDAQAKADAAMEEARKKLDVNFYASLSIPKEAYAQQVQANLVAGAGAIQAATEGEGRGAGAVAGMVQAQQNQAQNEIRANMGQDIYNLQAATAQEDARLRDIGIQLDLGEVEGAQLAAANAQEMSAQALQQGMQGVTSLAGQAAEMAPLFEKSASTRQYNKLIKENVGDQPGQYKTIQDFQNSLPGTQTSTSIDLSGVGSTTDSAYIDNQINTLMTQAQANGAPITREQAAKQVTGLMTGNQFMDYMIQQDKGQLKGLRRGLNNDIIRF
jgi:hypothetical protein